MGSRTGLTLAETARLCGGRVVGDGARLVVRIAPLEDAGPRDLSLLASPKYREEAARSRAGALLVRSGFQIAGRDQVVVDDPHLALVSLLPVLHPQPAPASGVSPHAHVDARAKLGEGVGIGPFVVVEEGARIGARTWIGAGGFLGAGSEVGEDSLLYPSVTVYRGCCLGNRVIVHSGAVIGSDGFGFATQQGIHRKVPQIGAVVVEDDVEIGAGVTIDRGSIGTTRVGRGTKIDNLVQIGHNVQIGPHCLIVAQVGIAGSSRIGAGSIFAGQSGAAGHLEIGAGVVVASKSAVYDDLPDGAYVAGIPAVEAREWKKSQAIIGRLPDLRRRLLAVEDRLSALGDDRPTRSRSGATKKSSPSADSNPRRGKPGAGSAGRRAKRRVPGAAPKGRKKP